MKLTNGAVIQTKHPQAEAFIRGQFVDVDEDIAVYITWLNRYGFYTMFSCQGDHKDQHGYIVFEPGVVFLDRDRHQVENRLGILEIVPIRDFQEDEEVPDDLRYWEPPRDYRNEGGRLFGWSLYFRYLPNLNAL